MKPRYKLIHQQVESHINESCTHTRTNPQKREMCDTHISFISRIVYVTYCECHICVCHTSCVCVWISRWWNPATNWFTNKSSRISMSRIHARVWNLKKDIIIVPREKALETNTSTNHVTQQQVTSHIHESCIHTREKTGIIRRRGGGLGSSTIFKKFNEPYAPS